MELASFDRLFKNLTSSMLSQTNYNDTTSNIMDLRQPRVYPMPLLTLFLASMIMGKSSAAKPCLRSQEQLPTWVLLNPFMLNIMKDCPIITKPDPPQIQAPQVSIRDYQLHDADARDREINHQLITESNENFTGDINHSEEETLQDLNYSNQHFKTEEDTSSNLQHISSTDKIINKESEDNASDNLDVKTMFPSSTENINLEEENLDAASTNVRTRRTAPRPGLRRGIYRRPINDYDYKNTFRNRFNRGTTTSVYDGFRKRKHPSRKQRPSRRPIKREPEYYDSELKDESYYDYDDYSSIFARQASTESDTTESSSISTTTAGSTQTSQATTQSTGTSNAPTTSMQTAAPQTQTPGYTYGPPVQGYGPPAHTGYGPPAHTGYGPSNGNEHISITYPPVSEPGRDPLDRALEYWYNYYAKGPLLRRLQELIQTNYYNPQYDAYDNL